MDDSPECPNAGHSGDSSVLVVFGFFLSVQRP
jgi:hypothetical protein